MARDSATLSRRAPPRLWQSHTMAKAGCSNNSTNCSFVQMQKDGNLVMYKGSGVGAAGPSIWSTGTKVLPAGTKNARFEVLWEELDFRGYQSGQLAVFSDVCCTHGSADLQSFWTEWCPRKSRSSHKTSYEHRKNVLWMIADDLRPEMNLAYGQKHMVTPAFDRLAKEGSVFTRAYCQIAVCAPSRNSFMSGPRRLGA